MGPEKGHTGGPYPPLVLTVLKMMALKKGLLLVPVSARLKFVLLSFILFHEDVRAFRDHARKHHWSADLHFARLYHEYGTDLAAASEQVGLIFSEVGSCLSDNLEIEITYLRIR